ncbi:hypothetical protein ACFLSH_01595 [Bacteroidota bacterium]
MRRILIATITVVLFVVFLSCSQEGNPLNNGDMGKDYLPVKVGANWHWISTQNNNSTTIERIIELDSDGYYKAEKGISGPGGVFVSRYYKKIDETGVKIFRDKDSIFYFELKKPYKIGTAWSYQTSIETVDCRIVAQNIIESVSAGTFVDCIKVVHTIENSLLQETYTVNYTYAPNVGLIKTDFQELENYHIP